MLRDGELIKSDFWARDFGAKRGTKTGVMQRIMRIFETKFRVERSVDKSGFITLTFLRPWLK
jgi:hypothetical protein